MRGMDKQLRSSRKLLGAKSKLFSFQEEEKEEDIEQPESFSNVQKFHEFEKDRVEEKFSKTTHQLRKGVKNLKIMSTAIRDHMDEDKDLISGVEDGIDHTREKLNKTHSGLKGLMGSRTTRHMCIMILFVLFVLFAIYFLIKYSLNKSSQPQ